MDCEGSRPSCSAILDGHSTIYVKLAYLKNRMPRMAQKPLEDKLVSGSPSQLLEDHCASELMHAVESKDVKAFRMAIEALVMNCFEYEEKENG